MDAQLKELLMGTCHVAWKVEIASKSISNTNIITIILNDEMLFMVVFYDSI